MDAQASRAVTSSAPALGRFSQIRMVSAEVEKTRKDRPKWFPKRALAKPPPCPGGVVRTPSLFIRSSALEPKFSLWCRLAIVRYSTRGPSSFAAVQQLHRFGSKADISFGTSRHWVHESTAYQATIRVPER
jgi:hypothetical protein